MEEKQSSVSLSPTQETPQTWAIQGAAAEDGDKDEVFSSKSALKSSSSGDGGSSRSSSVSGFESQEEDFVSGDDFETASERPSVGDPDEEILELAMEEEGMVEIVGDPVVGSSNFSDSVGNSEVLGAGNDVLVDGVVRSEVGDDRVDVIPEPVGGSSNSSSAVGNLEVSGGEKDVLVHGVVGSEVGDDKVDVVAEPVGDSSNSSFAVGNLEVSCGEKDVLVGVVGSEVGDDKVDAVAEPVGGSSNFSSSVGNSELLGGEKDALVRGVVGSEVGDDGVDGVAEPVGGSSNFSSSVKNSEVLGGEKDVLVDGAVGSEVSDRVPAVGEPIGDFSNFSSSVGNSEVSGREKDVLVDGVVGGVDGVEVQEVQALGSEEGELVGDSGIGISEPKMIEEGSLVNNGAIGGEEGESVGEGVLGDSGIGNNEPKMIEEGNLLENSSLVGNSENGVSGLEGKGIGLDENLVSDSGLNEFGGDKVPGVTEVYTEPSVEKEKNVLNGNVEVNEVGNLAIGSQEEEKTEVREAVVEEKKSEALSLGSVEFVADKVPEDTVAGALAEKEGHLVPENGSREDETNEVRDVVVEEKKNQVLDSGSIEFVAAKVPEVTVAEALFEKEDMVPENMKLNEMPENGSPEDETNELKDGLEKSEILAGDDLATVDSTDGGNSYIASEQHTETCENEVSDIKEVEVPVEKSAVLVSENDQASTVTEELVDSNFVEEGKEVNSIKGDSHVETIGPITSEVEAGGAVGKEEKGTAEAGALALAVGKTMDVGIVSDQAPAVVESEDPKVVEADSDLTHVEHHVSKAEVEKEEEADELKDDRLVVSVNPDEKIQLEKGPDSDIGVELNDPMFKLATDRVESKLDGLDEPQNADEEEAVIPSTVQKDKVQLLVSERDEAGVAAQVTGSEDVMASASLTPELPLTDSTLDSEVKEEAYELKPRSDSEEVDGSTSDEDNEGLIFDGSEAAKQIMKELMQGSGSYSAAQSSQEDSQRIDGQIVMDSDEEVETDEEEDGKELFDSAALAALLKAASGGGSEGGNVTITSQDGSKLFSVERPAGLGSSVRPLRSAPRPKRPNIFHPSDLTSGGVAENLSEEEKKKLERIQLIRVKYLRLLHRLGNSPDDSIAAQVLYRLLLTAGRHTVEPYSPETAKKTAMQLESEAKNDLDFSLNILVLGKTGVGKSATINSIFGEEKAKINAFQPATTTVKEIIGTVGGVKIRVFDTPGLKSSAMEQAFNRKILSSVKKSTKKFPPDILLYVDRLDTQTRDLNDLPLLRTITSVLDSSIWRSAVVTLTHGASAPPDGPSGNPLSYEVFVAQRSHVVQQSIGQAVGDLRMMNPSLMNPVTLVENHSSCRRNREGQRILPNGQSWRSQLLLLCYSLKILSETTSLSKPQDPFDHRKLFGFRVRSPPLPYLLSSLLQSRAHPKLPTDLGGENIDSDIELEDQSDSDQEDEEDEYDLLPPFKPLRKAQIAKLSKEQRKAYFDEYDYRVKLLQKKQWKEELKRMKEMKKKGKGNADDYGFVEEDGDPEGGAAAPVQVPLPDMVLPPSFDGDNPAYRYRFLEPTSQLLARPVLDTHGWDHDCGYDGVSLEESLAIAGKFPAGVAVQITKDKKEFNIHLDSSVAAKHGENGSTLAGFDIQTIGKHLAYIIRGETKFKKLKRNKMASGISVTFLGESIATGAKFEDQISIGKRLTLVGSTGTVRSQGDAAYGVNVEARLKEKDFPIGQDQSTLGISLMKWKGHDLALGANLQSQFSIGRSSKMAVRVGLNNKLSGQITVRTSSSEQLQLALVGILPIALSIYRTFWPETSESFSAY